MRQSQNAKRAIPFFEVIMPTYRVAVIGHTGRGNYGHGIDRVWLDFPECEIVAVADADENGRAAAVKRLTAGGKTPAAFADFREMLTKTKPDIVAVCPRFLDEHHAMILAAIESGAHVYTEKPFCRTLEEADEIVAACEKKQRKLAIAHQTRYSPKLHVVRQMIEDGAIGEVIELRGRGKEDRRGGGEDLWVLGSHILNLMNYFGGEPTSCFARVMWQGEPVTRENIFDGPEGIGPLAGDRVAATYEMRDGITGYFNSVRNGGPGGTARFGLRICGTKGCIDVLTGHLPPMHYLPDPLWAPGRSGKEWIPISSAGAGKDEPLKDEGLHGGNVLAVKDLLAAIEEDRLPECNVYEARWTVEMIAGVFASHVEGEPVALPLKNRGNPLA
jgi:predicted dehydrogenase